MKELYKYVILIVAIIILFVLGYIVMVTLTDSMLEKHNKEVTNLEIERKFIVDVNNIPYDLSSKKYYEITQTYINYSPEIRVRKIIYGNEEFYKMTIKRYVNDEALTREETEFYITKEEYEETVVNNIGNTILKNRYQFEDENGTLLALDIFKGDLEGLAYLEIEFESEQEANLYVIPSWVVKEVTNDRRYKNGYLSRYGIPIEEEI